MTHYGQCPRCGQWSLERLRSHAHCWECSYFPEATQGLAHWERIESAGLRGSSIRSGGRTYAIRCPLRDASQMFDHDFERSSK